MWAIELYDEMFTHTQTYKIFSNSHTFPHSPYTSYLAHNPPHSHLISIHTSSRPFPFPNRRGYINKNVILSRTTTEDHIASQRRQAPKLLSILLRLHVRPLLVRGQHAGHDRAAAPLLQAATRTTPTTTNGRAAAARERTPAAAAPTKPTGGCFA